MSFGWRLGVLGIQLVLLLGVTRSTTGEFYSAEAWFMAGLLCLVVNKQMLEPFFAGPSDVIANSIIGLALYFTSPHEATAEGWHALATALAFALAASVLSVVLSRSAKAESNAARALRVVTREATAQRVYSAVFLLSLVELHFHLPKTFWPLVIAWGGILIVGSINWQAVWQGVAGKGQLCRVEGMTGPSRLIVSAPDLPPPGTRVVLAGAARGEGVVTTRIRRAHDSYGHVHIEDQGISEALLSSSMVSLELQADAKHDVVGSVEPGSTETKLAFSPVRPMVIGDVVSVRCGGVDVLYQLFAAQVREDAARGFAHLSVSAQAMQLGVYDHQLRRLQQHRWVPSPGASVTGLRTHKDEPAGHTPIDGQFLLGYAMGTDIPIYLDLAGACEGHLAVLGMTKMGKTTLVSRLAKELGRSRHTLVLDQTGEYVGRRGMERHVKDASMDDPGLSVVEPPKPTRERTPAHVALMLLERLMEAGRLEYDAGDSRPRSLVIDEAHQFLPEPAGLGFNTPGRDQSYAFGLLMMQVRKYGISVVLVSQRTAVVAKSALSQCENLIAFKSVDQTGLDYLESIAGSAVRGVVAQLRQGEALVFGPAVSADAPVAVRLVSPSAGETLSSQV